VAAGLVVTGFVRWLVTRWKLDGATLRIETGLLRRDSRQLPMTRIQAVDVVRPFLARVLGLAALRIRLAGAGNAGDRLAYLTVGEAARLRATLLAGHHGLDPVTPEPVELLLITVPAGRVIGQRRGRRHGRARDFPRLGVHPRLDRARARDQDVAAGDGPLRLYGRHRT
jgi:putative membrane protein